MRVRYPNPNPNPNPNPTPNPTQAGVSEAEVQRELLGRVRKLLPWLPEPAKAVLRPWRTSQVRQP